MLSSDGGAGEQPAYSWPPLPVSTFDAATFTPRRLGADAGNNSADASSNDTPLRAAYSSACRFCHLSKTIPTPG